MEKENQHLEWILEDGFYKQSTRGRRHKSNIRSVYETACIGDDYFCTTLAVNPGLFAYSTRPDELLLEDVHHTN